MPHVTRATHKGAESDLSAPRTLPSSEALGLAEESGSQ